jgi:hypothetical protein
MQHAPSMLIERIDFDPYVWRDRQGIPHFANRMPWPLYIGLWHMRRRERNRRQAWRNHRIQQLHCGIDRSSKIAAARRWIPMNPLNAHQMWVEDKLRGR